MKTLLTIAILLIGASLVAQDSINYVNDTIVTVLIQTEPVKVSVLDFTESDKEKSWFFIYPSHELIIRHRQFIPYKQKDGWYFRLTTIQGDHIYIDQSKPYGRLRYETYNKMKSMCARYE